MKLYNLILSPTSTNLFRTKQGKVNNDDIKHDVDM